MANCNALMFTQMQNESVLENDKPNSKLFSRELFYNTLKLGRSFMLLNYVIAFLSPPPPKKLYGSLLPIIDNNRTLKQSIHTIKYMD